MKRKRTERERHMLLSKKRHRHELRKRRKQKGQSATYSDDSLLAGYDYTPNIQAMFRMPKEKKK